MFALLRTRRWQGFTAVVIIAIIAFGLLSRWQWARAEEKQLQQQAQELGQQTPITPQAQDPVLEFTAVTLTGEYLPQSQRLVRQRPLEGRNGFWVMEQLATDQGDVWVLRGWVPTTAGAGDSPEVPAASSLRVTVTGVARPLPDGEPLVDRGGLPEQQVTEIVAAQLPNRGAMDWYLQQVDSQPADPLTVVPLPEPDDLQNISYAVQWLLFAAVAIGGWYLFLRREAKEST
jgi:cytochrome oxidase assembly protein ShyY1